MYDQDSADGKNDVQKSDTQLIMKYQITQPDENGYKRGMVIVAPGKVSGIKKIVGFIIEQPGKTGLQQVDYQPGNKEYEKNRPFSHFSSRQSSVVSRQSSVIGLLTVDC
jgi:hypothetical protein